LLATSLEMSMASAHAVTLEHDVIVRTSTDLERRSLEHEALTKQGFLGRIDDHETVRSSALVGLGWLHHFRDAGFFVAVVQSRPLMRSAWRERGLCQARLSLKTLALPDMNVKCDHRKRSCNLEQLRKWREGESVSVGDERPGGAAARGPGVAAGRLLRRALGGVSKREKPARGIPGPARLDAAFAAHHHIVAWIETAFSSARLYVRSRGS